MKLGIVIDWLIHIFLYISINGYKWGFLSIICNDGIHINAYNYLYFVKECKKQISIVETGIFGADMKVSLLNDGPVTIIIDS